MRQLEKAPAGYRWLRVGEPMKGAKFYSKSANDWITTEFGETFVDAGDVRAYIVPIRPIKKARKG